MPIAISRRLVLLAAAAAAPLTVLAGPAVAQDRSIVVGGKNFTEQLILAEITALVLRAKGVTVEKKDGLASALLRQAQESGEVDVYWEYTGTSLVVYNGVEERLSPEETYQRVKQLDAEKGLVWLNASTANNTYAFATRGDAEPKLATISELAAAVEGGADLKFATDPEFTRRQDGLAGLQEAYGFRFPRTSLVLMDPGLTYEALDQERVDAAVVLSTDGRVKAFDLAVLEDDKAFFPSYALTPVARQDALDEVPGLADALNDLSGRLTDDTVRGLNAAVDVDGRTVEEVAAEFLRQQKIAS